MLKTVLSPFTDHSYALLRMVSGFLFSFHGVQKIFGLWSSHGRPPVGSQMWIGGLIELVCGLAILIGLGTRWAAFLASGTMAVAYAQFHWKFQGGSQLLPGVNGGEPAAVYAWLFLYMACKGAGPWSVDAKRAQAEARR